MGNRTAWSGRPASRSLPRWVVFVGVRFATMIALTSMAVLIGVTSAAASSPTLPPYVGNPQGVSLGMLGDSITNQSRSTLHEALDPTYRSAIDGYGGATVASHNSDGSIAELSQRNPAVIVFNLGTNDLVQVVTNPDSYPLSAFESDYATMRAAFKGCAVVTTINDHRDGGGALSTVPNGTLIYNKLAGQFNGWLRAHYAHVADWGALTTEWHNAGTWTTYMQDDTVHPTPAGQVALAELIRAQADKCYPSRVVTATSTTTAIDDASSNMPWAGTEATGASAYGTATVTSGRDMAPTGTVTYSFFLNGTCSGTPSSTQSVTLNDGAAPDSSTVGPLRGGSYSLDAVYGGDINYDASPVSSCQPFTVTPAPTTVTTVADDATSNADWAGTEVTGASAYDTATVTGNPSIEPTGNVIYSYFLNGTCSGSPNTTQSVTLSNGAVPDSSTVGPLAAGTYSFDAVYGGDGNYSPSPVSGCEPFTVAPAPTTVETMAVDATSNAAWAGTEVTGASAYDTATVTGNPGIAPTGTVTYSYFLNGTCSGSPNTTQSVTLSNGAVPDSSTVGPLAAGTYSFDALYGGDGNYDASPVSACEPFTVAPAPTTVATTVDDAATNAPWNGSEVLGASAYDTATVTGSPGIAPTGNVTYSFFVNGSCSGSPLTTQSVTLNSGAVPDSSTVGPLAPGSYSFDAVYGGDGNYDASPVSACETFTVGL